MQRAIYIGNGWNAFSIVVFRIFKRRSVDLTVRKCIVLSILVMAVSLAKIARMFQGENTSNLF